MKRIHAISLISAALLLPLSACTFLLHYPENDTPDDEEEGGNTEQNQDPGPVVFNDGEYSVLEFREISGDITNPERGFYYPYDLSSSNNKISASEVRSKRKSGHTILFTQYILNKWMSSDIPDSFLSAIQSNMDALRDGGAKCVLRFCYKQNESESNKPWDADEEWVMRHIRQIKPILQENEDVILLFQAGFVGVWGEWYYTDHFIMEPETPEDYLPRKRVLEAMLEALPASRQVAVRTPDFKMNMYGLSLADTLNASTAHDGSLLSRIGGYNDCFGANEDDYGTYTGNDARAFWKADTRYTFMGGETCALSDYCRCPVTISDMEKYHWTYINIGYNESVIRNWKNEGCYNEIKQRLGYRIVLENIKHTLEPKSGETYKVELNFRNDGFSAFQNARNADLVFVASNGKTTTIHLETDPRTWHPGRHRIQASFSLPAAKGTLYLHLSDPLLPDRPEFSAALANQDVWESSTGYNKLLDIE